MTEAYEQEVEQILKEANSKVHQAAKVVEKCRGENAAQQVEKLRKQYEQEKAEGLNKLQTLRTSFSSREQKNNAMWTERIKQMSGELLSLKQQCTQQASNFKVQLHKAEEQYSSRLAELTAQHKAELENAVKNHEEGFQQRMR